MASAVWKVRRSIFNVIFADIAYDLRWHGRQRLCQARQLQLCKALSYA